MGALSFPMSATPTLNVTIDELWHWRESKPPVWTRLYEMCVPGNLVVISCCSDSSLWFIDIPAWFYSDITSCIGAFDTELLHWLQTGLVHCNVSFVLPTCSTQKVMTLHVSGTCRTYIVSRVPCTLKSPLSQRVWKTQSVTCQGVES